MKLLSMFGIDAKVRRLKIAAGESAIAAGDRANLLGLAWQEEKQRLTRAIVFSLVALCLTAVVIALGSLAVVIHFWDTPQRMMAAWSVAGLWAVVWLVCVIVLMSALRSPSTSLVAAQEVLTKDLDWAQTQFGIQADRAEHADGQLTRDELLARIDVQRQRIATLQAPDEAKAEAAKQAEATNPYADESAVDTVVRVARTHPIATGVAATVTFMVLGPGRLLRWTAFLAPIVWRLR